jgi:hypothetical protein
MRRVAVALAALALVAAACDATQSGGGGGKGDGLEEPFTIDDLPADVELGAPEAVLAGWEGVEVRSVCLDVEVSSQIDAGMRQGTRYATRQALTMRMLLEGMLTGMGIEVVEKGCDATMTFDLSGSTVGATYEDWGYCHTDARYSGTMTLEGEGPTVSRSFEVSADSPPYLLSLGDCGSDPAEAYADAYTEWMPGFVAALGEIWGERPAVVASMLDPWEGPKVKLEQASRRMGDELPILLVTLLEHPQVDAYRVGGALGKLGEDAEAVVPTMIRSLDTLKGGERSPIEAALAKITGERRLHGLNDWLAWWGEQAA